MNRHPPSYWVEVPCRNSQEFTVTLVSTLSSEMSPPLAADEAVKLEFVIDSSLIVERCMIPPCPLVAPAFEKLQLSTVVLLKSSI